MSWNIFSSRFLLKSKVLKLELNKLFIKSDFTSVKVSNYVFILQNVRFYKHKSQTKKAKKPMGSMNLTEEELYERFQDTKTVKVIAGNGGDGIASFFRGWCLPEGGPDGGNGGKGGDIIFVADKNTKSLTNVPAVCQGENGQIGGITNCSGRNGKDKYISVPIGTYFTLKNSDKIYADLSNEGEEFVGGYGGLGGKGNKFFTTSLNTAPEDYTVGKTGDQHTYILQIKTLAHAGLVGLPNAGKSTILTALTNATPLIADYPYTTLIPHVGILQYKDFVQIAIADIPGILQGAHKNEGEGIQFLKHIQRCRFFIYVIDMSENDPWEQFCIIRRELELFDKKLINLPGIVACNKMDLDKRKIKLKKFRKKFNNIESSCTLIPISGLTNLNIELVIEEVRKLYDTDLLANPNDALIW